MSQNLLLPSNYIVRIRCLLPLKSAQATSLSVIPDKRNQVMTTSANNISSSSFGFVSSKSSTSQTTCNICERLLYSFEEVLHCQICYGSYHRRCVKPETISYYGDNKNYICDKCKGDQTTNSPQRLSNGSSRTKSTDSFDTDDQDFVNVPSKRNSTGMNEENPVRHFEDKQQQARQSQLYQNTKVSDLDDYLPTKINGNEYHHHNGQYNDDSRTTRRIQQQQQHHHQQNGIGSDEENERAIMFQANYHYTPLQEYAALRNNRTNNDNHSQNYSDSPPDNSDRQPTSRYGGGLRYSNHGYDPTVTRLVETPVMATTNFASPTVDNLSNHNRQQHFISTTNLNINEKPSRQQQQQQQQPNPVVQSTPYSSPNRDNDLSVYKRSPHSHQQTDRHSNAGSDSGIVIVNSQQQQQQQHPPSPPSNENHHVEHKLTNLVQQLGKQLENDAQKLNEKLESKLKNLENMIHQQTFIIRQQDDVIERLKGQILDIERERDHFRQQLTVHELREEKEKKQFPSHEREKFSKQDYIYEQDHQSDRKYSTSSSIPTDNSKRTNKKSPAPRIEVQWPPTKNEHEPAIAKLVKHNPVNRERVESDSSSGPAMISKLVSSVPVVEKPAASSRLDNIIHQNNSRDVINPSSSNYSLAQVRHQDRPQLLEPVAFEQEEVTISVHHDDDQNKNAFKQKRSNSSSSSSSAASLPPQPVKTNTSTTNRNSNKYPSFESLQNTYQNDQSPKLVNKTASLQFGTKPVQDNDMGSIYLTPVEANHPAIQSNSPVKGWLRKQNRDSFLKRIERYYCVLTNDALLMHKHDYDRTPYKAINLKGAKVLYYDDQKYGPSLELTWSNRSRAAKHYHLYAYNPQEADQWLNGIQTTITNLETKNRWQRYHMNTPYH